MTTWMKSRSAFCQVTMLPLIGIALWGFSHNEHFIYSHFQSPVRLVVAGIVLLFLLGVSLFWTHRRRQPLLPDAGELWCMFGLAVIYSFAGNVALYNHGSCFLVSFFSAMGALCLLWALLGRYALIFWVPFLFVEIGQVCAFQQYGMLVNRQLVLAEVFAASHAETMVYVTPFNIMLALLALLAAGLLAWMQLRLFRGLPRLPLVNIGILSLLLAGVSLAFHSPAEKSEHNFWPVYEACIIPANIASASALNERTQDYVRSLPSPAEKPSAISTLAGQQGVVLVLHVGESVRADRLTLNGYTHGGRSTCPWLCSQQAAGRLVSYTDCISSSPHTCTSLITILTDARRSLTDPDPAAAARAGSVLDLFAANRFAVYSFLGRASQQVFKYDAVSKTLSQASRERFNAPGNPQTVLPMMDGVLAQNAGDNLAFFINNEGSHAPFGYYDAERAPFLPAEPCLSNPAANAESVNNAYDNTIHYTDEFIRQVVQKLQGRPFIYIYVSDHGEYLGHDGLWGRGGISPENYHRTSGCRVGMFIITSPEFEALHPHFAEAVKNLRAHADMTVGHEHIYHTLLGIFGIETPYYNAKLDLSGDAPEPYTGPYPGKPHELQQP